MSLDTVLKIGKALRKADNSLKYFKYVEPCPKDKDGNYPLCITIPVKEDFSFDWENVKITPEKERENLYYLKFKTSDSDGLVKYIFGDIYFKKKAKISRTGEVESSEGGYYRLANLLHTNAAFRPSSFMRGMNDYREIINSSPQETIIEQFHTSLEKEIKIIENILQFIPAIEYYFNGNLDEALETFLSVKAQLKEITIKHNFDKAGATNRNKMKVESDYQQLTDGSKKKLFDYCNASIFIHFQFSEEKHWYQFEDDFNLIKLKILSDFVDTSQSGLTLKKTLYKTLCSGDKKNDIQFPSFETRNKHKSKIFSEDEMNDLFCALDYTNKGRLISGTEIKMIVMPYGENLTAKDYEDFVEKRDEVRVVEKNKSGMKAGEPLFDFFSEKENANITSFDLVFCKKGGLTSPDSDLIEISGIQKSKLRQIKERIEKASSKVYQERREFLKTEKELSILGIEYSFRNILGNPQTDNNSGKVSIKPNPKYQSHLLKALPLIYTENYHHDEILLPAFIQNVEYSIRAGDEKYSFLKFDLMFLLKIQNTKSDQYMEITESPSYQIGVKLGKLSKPLKKKINSFEKRYVGLLTRHTSTKDDCIRFANDINEMLTRHEKTWGQMSAEVNEALAKLPLKDYDREKLVFGFFEGYFKYEAGDKKKDFFSRLEKLLTDYEGNEELQETVDQFTELLNQIKTETTTT